MFKSFLIAATLVVSAAANAHNTLAESILASQLSQIQESVVTQGLDWKVGQENNYKLNMGGFLNGTMKVFRFPLAAQRSKPNPGIKAS